MKRIIFFSLILMAFLLNACASTPPARIEGNHSAADPTQVAEIVGQELATSGASSTQVLELNTTYENAVSVETQLLLGTFKLEETDQAVTKEQAAILLPLWTNFKTLSQSMRPERGAPGQRQGDSTPQAIPTVNQETQTQMKALIKEILAALTPEQIQAISAMKITRETSMLIMQEQGITMGGPQQGTGNAAGQPAQGTPPVGRPQPGGIGQMSTPPVGGGMQAGAGLLPTELVDALIKILQNKAG